MNSDRSDDDIQVTILAWLDRQGADVAAEARPLSDLLVGIELSLDEFNHAIGGLVEPGHVRREPTDSAGSALDARFWITPSGRANARERIQPLAPWSNLGYGYRTNDKKLTYRGNPLPGVDRGSFETLNLHWVRDQKSVFNVGRKLKADRDSFLELNCLFARDKDTIFCFAGPAKFLDVESFEVLDSGGFCSEESNWPPIYVGFCRDKSGVYYYDIGCHKPRLLKGADAESFTPLGYGFAKDRARCYYNYTTLKGAKPESFESLSQRFSRDAERVFCHSFEIGGADRDSFEVYPSAGRGMRVFGRDNNAVYFRQDRVEGADPATFRPTANLEGADRNRTWKLIY